MNPKEYHRLECVDDIYPIDSSTYLRVCIKTIELGHARVRDLWLWNKLIGRS